MGENNGTATITYSLADGTSKTFTQAIEFPKLENLSDKPGSDEVKFNGGSMSFDLEIGSVKALELFGIYLISNNWRRLHHLPMKRRCKQ